MLRLSLTFLGRESLVGVFLGGEAVFIEWIIMR